MIKRLLLLLSACWLAGIMAAAGAQARVPATSNALALPPPQAGANVLEVEGLGQHWRLELTDNAAPFAKLGSASTKALFESGSRFFRGHVTGAPGSWVRLNWVDGRWWGAFHDGQALYLIDEAGGLQQRGGAKAGATGAEAGPTVVFRAEDLELDGLIDHGGVPVDAPRPPRALGEPQAQPAGAGPQAMPVTIVADTQFQQKHGANATSIVAGRINVVDGIYAAQTGYGVVLHHYQALANNGTLTPNGANALLVAFKDYMASNNTIPFKGLAHLFTSRDRDGSTAGIAYLDALCLKGWGYGVDWDKNIGSETTSSLVLAHELGHNFSAPHDGQTVPPGQPSCASETFKGIMNPSINGSQQFSTCSLSYIQPAAARASCMVTAPDAGLIFSDRFQN